MLFGGMIFSIGKLILVMMKPYLKTAAGRELEEEYSKEILDDHS